MKNRRRVCACLVAVCRARNAAPRPPRRGRGAGEAGSGRAQQPDDRNCGPSWPRLPRSLIGRAANALHAECWRCSSSLREKAKFMLRLRLGRGGGLQVCAITKRRRAVRGTGAGGREPTPDVGLPGRVGGGCGRRPLLAGRAPPRSVRRADRRRLFLRLRGARGRGRRNADAGGRARPHREAGH